MSPERRDSPGLRRLVFLPHAVLHPGGGDLLEGHARRLAVPARHAGGGAAVDLARAWRRAPRACSGSAPFPATAPPTGRPSAAVDDRAARRRRDEQDGGEHEGRYDNESHGRSPRGGSSRAGASHRTKRQVSPDHLAPSGNSIRVPVVELSARLGLRHVVHLPSPALLRGPVHPHRFAHVAGCLKVLNTGTLAQMDEDKTAPCIGATLSHLTGYRVTEIDRIGARRQKRCQQCEHHESGSPDSAPPA